MRWRDDTASEGIVEDELGWRDAPGRRARDRGLWRILLAGVVAVASLTAGFWFGGDTARGVSVWAVVALGIAVLLGDLLGPPDRRGARMLSAMVMAGLFVIGWYGGIVELGRAFEQCVERGESVRGALGKYRTSAGEYPNSLTQLEDVAIPGRRLLRPGLMEYSRVDDGYRLSFADGVATISATDERGFFVRDGRR
jgi:hypothetical protein